MPRLYRLICVTAGLLAIFASGCNSGLQFVKRQPQPVSSTPILPSQVATPTFPLPPADDTYNARQVALESLESKRAIDVRRSRNESCSFG